MEVNQPTRERAPRGSLNPRRIVVAALDILDAEGMGGLTMSRVATHLEVGTMSLYRHFRNKATLVEAVADLIFENLSVPPGEPDDWETRVVGYLREWRHLALAHPSLLDILATRPIATSRVEEHLETNITVLRAAGFPDDEAVRAFYALFAYVFGFVVWEIPRQPGSSGSSYVEDRREQLDDLPTSRFPALSELAAVAATNATGEQFEYGLARLISGIAMTIE